MNEPVRPSLSGQTTVVLGGTGSVGEGIVKAHIAAGATVVVPSRNVDRIEVVRRSLGDNADRLIGIEGDTQTFDGMQKVAHEAVERAGTPTQVVTSIGGWYMGDPVWQIDEATWKKYFVDSSTAHFAAARAFIPELPEGGSYTIILGMSAHLAMPTTSPLAMHGGALRVLRQVLSAEVGQARRVNSLTLGQIIGRSRPRGEREWLTAEDVGRLTVRLATTNVTGQDFQVPVIADYKALMNNDLSAENSRP